MLGQPALLQGQRDGERGAAQPWIASSTGSSTRPWRAVTSRRCGAVCSSWTVCRATSLHVCTAAGTQAQPRLALVRSDSPCLIAVTLWFDAPADSPLTPTALLHVNAVCANPWLTQGHLTGVLLSQHATSACGLEVGPRGCLYRAPDLPSIVSSVDVNDGRDSVHIL